MMVWTRLFVGAITFLAARSFLKSSCEIRGAPSITCAAGRSVKAAARTIAVRRRIHLI